MFLLFLFPLIVQGISRQLAFLDKNFTSALTESDDVVKASLIKVAHWSNAAYCSEKQLFSWDCGASCDIEGEQLAVKYYKSDALSGSALYLGIHEKSSSIVVSYRGTRNFMSFVNDLFAMKLNYRYKGGRVHSGFYRSYARLSTDLLKHIRGLLSDVTYTDSPIIVTGHSYGGALATFLALELKLDYSIENPIFLRTFEAPRVGDADFADFFTKAFFESNEPALPVLRVTNSNDPVVRLPPSILHFVHYPHEIWLVDGEVRLDRCIDVSNELDDKHLCREDPSCSVSKVPWNFNAHSKLLGISFGYSCRKQ